MPAGFFLRRSVGTEQALPHPISSLAVSIGDMLDLDVGAVAWTAADANSLHWTKKAVAVEAVANTATSVLAIDVLPGQLWEAEGVNSAAAADNNDRMVLTDKNTVNNTGTDSAAKEAVFIQTGYAGATTDKRLLGEIVYGNGINPAAA